MCAPRRFVKLNVTTTALRGVDKAGGLDNYLLYNSDDRLQSTQVCKVEFTVHYLINNSCSYAILVPAPCRRML